MDGTKTDTNDSLTANYLYNIDFISFLNENFMPYIFIWSGFIFRNLNFKGKNGETITHLTSGSIEKEFGTIKKANGHPGLHPADYVQTRVASTLTNCVVSQSTILKTKPQDKNKSMIDLNLRLL